MPDSRDFLALSNLVAAQGIKYFVETNAEGSAEGLETAAQLGLHAHVCDPNGRNAVVLAQRYPDFDLYDGSAADFLGHVLPKLDAPAFFLLSNELERNVVEIESEGHDWFFEMKDVGDRVLPAETNIPPADAPIEPGCNPDGSPSQFDRNWVGPQELKPSVYRSQSEKDTWYAIVVENEYRCPQFKPADVVIDIGTNIGSFVKRAHLMGSREIYGFEPSAYYMEAAQANVGGLDGVNLFQQAMVRSDDKRKEQYFHDGGMGTFADHGNAVDSAALDDVLTEVGPVRFLKIDCEGGEWPILGTSKMLHRVQEIAGEYHLGNYGAGLTFEPTITNLEKLLRANGFDQITFVKNAATDGNFFARRMRHESNPDYSLGN